MKRYMALPLVFLTAACGLLGGGDDPPPGKIVFSAQDGNGVFQLYTMRADGSQLRQITRLTEAGAYEPSWSPDGRQIVFTTSLNSTTLGLSIYIIDSNGGNPRPLKSYDSSPSALWGSSPRWSPDGKKVAFSRCSRCEVGGSNYEIYMYEFATDSVRRITDHPAIDWFPSWSPDSDKILFSSERDYINADSARYRQELYVINIDGSNLRKLTDTGNASAFRSAWSPDGSKIAIDQRGPGNNVFIYEFDGGVTTRLETGMEFSGNPVWNSSSTTVLVSGRETNLASPQFRWVDLKSNILHTLPINKDQRGYDWYPYPVLD